MPRHPKNRTNCIECNIDLNISNSVFMGFSRNARCRECYNKYHIKYRKNNKDRIKEYRTTRENNLKRLYNITEEKYNNLVELHLHGCAICKKFCETLAIDHCHINGNIRGLLCTKCNMALGGFNDDEELLSNAIEYLKQNKDLRKVG